MGQGKENITPVHYRWSPISPALTHRNIHSFKQLRFPGTEITQNNVNWYTRYTCINRWEMETKLVVQNRMFVILHFGICTLKWKWCQFDEGFLSLATLGRISTTSVAASVKKIVKMMTFPDGTKPLPEPVLTNHQWSFMVSTLQQFYRQHTRYQFMIWVRKL